MVAGVTERIPANTIASAHAGVAEGSNPSGWRTWILPSAERFRVRPPPKPHSRATVRELREIHRLQEHQSKRRLRIIKKWNGRAGTLPWTETALEMIRIHRPAAFPTRTARALGLLHVGMYDALIAAADSRDAYRRARPFQVDEEIKRLTRARGSSYPDSNAAIAGAAERVLAYLFPQEPTSTFKKLANQASASRLWAGVNYRSDVQKGRLIGRRVADLVIAHGEADGHKTPPTQVLGTRLCSTPGCVGANEEFWVPTPPHYQFPSTDPSASKWTSYLIQSPNQFRPSLPYTYGSSQFCAELAEVKQANNTADESQKQLAFFWDDGPGTFSPAGHWNDIAVDLLRDRNVHTERAARIFAYMNAAIVDAFIATWDAKYAHWSQRPVTGIRERPALCGGSLYDPTWAPSIITPPFPAFPSGHSAESAAAARVLQYFFPDKGQDPGAIADDLGTTGGFDEIADEVALSRLMGGIHFRSDNERALVLGRQIAGLAIQRARADGAGP
jgi:hypothetical protein